MERIIVLHIQAMCLKLLDKFLINFTIIYIFFTAVLLFIAKSVES